MITLAAAARRIKLTVITKELFTCFTRLSVLDYIMSHSAVTSDNLLYKRPGILCLQQMPVMNRMNAPCGAPGGILSGNKMKTFAYKAVRWYNYSV